MLSKTSITTRLANVPMMSTRLSPARNRIEIQGVPNLGCALVSALGSSLSSAMA